MSAISIGGKSISIADIEQLVEVVSLIALDIENKKPAGDIAKDAMPLVLALSEDVVNTFFPGGGAAIELIVWILQHQRPLTNEEQNKWMDRFGAGSVS